MRATITWVITRFYHDSLLPCRYFLYRKRNFGLSIRETRSSPKNSELQTYFFKDRLSLFCRNFLWTDYYKICVSTLYNRCVYNRPYPPPFPLSILDLRLFYFLEALNNLYIYYKIDRRNSTKEIVWRKPPSVSVLLQLFTKLETE